jgi:hypothetical protein
MKILSFEIKNSKLQKIFNSFNYQAIGVKGYNINAINFRLCFKKKEA